MRRLCEIDFAGSIDNDGSPLGTVIVDGVKLLQNLLGHLFEEVETARDYFREPYQREPYRGEKDLYLLLELVINLSEDLEDCLNRLDSEILDVMLGKKTFSPEDKKHLWAVMENQQAERAQAELGEVSPAAAASRGPAIFSPEMSRQIQKLREADLGGVDID